MGRGMLGGMALLALLVAGPAAAQEGRIAVVGEGRATAVPDMARISLGVTGQAAGAAEAMATVSEAMEALMGVLTEGGVAPRDMRTGRLSVQPVYDQRDARDALPAIVGYTALNELDVAVRDLNAMGDLLDRALGVGGNRFSGLSFDVSDRAPLMDAARRDAVADGRARATLYAEAAGVTLGDLLRISEPGSGARPQFDMMESAAMRSVPIASGEMEVTARVEMLFAIAE